MQIRKVRWIASLGAILSSRTPANRIANWLLAAAVIFLIGAEEHARRTWRDRASEAQMALAGASVELSALRLAVEAGGSK